MAAQSALSVDLGGCACLVLLEDPGLAHRLAARYERFASAPASDSRSEQAFVLRVARPSPGGSGLSNLADLEPAFSNGRLRLRSRRVGIEIDLAQGRTRLPLDSDSPTSLEDLDYCLRLICALLAFEAGGLLLHAAAISQNGSGHVLFGPSGSGKTTAARNAAGRRVLNDDLVTLYPPDQPGKAWSAHATPFSNPSQQQPEGPACAEVASLQRLVKHQEPSSLAMRPALAQAALLACTPLIPLDPGRADSLCARLDALRACHPPHELRLRPDASYWRVLDPAARPDGEAALR